MSSFILPLGASVLVGGSRFVKPGPAWRACQEFVQSALLDHCVHVGCATGADQAAVLALGSGGAGARVFAAFARSGAGSFSGSAVATVQGHADLGGFVHFLAGGSLAVPLAARLISRSLAALRGCSAAVFFAPGAGSLKVARAALRQGIPVLVWHEPGMQVPALPLAPSLVQWLGLWFLLYQPPTQKALF